MTTYRRHTGPGVNDNATLMPWGYVLRNASSAERLKAQTELTVRPEVQGDFGPPPPSFKTYQAEPKGVIVPRAWGIEHFGPPAKYAWKPGVEIAMRVKEGFQLDATRSQDKAVEAIKQRLQTPIHAGGSTGILKLPCGGGKTVVICYAIAEIIRRKTLIVVHTKQLAAQWEERLSEFIPGVRVGRVQGGVTRTEDCDVVVGMLQTLSMKELPLDTFDDIGCIVFDECHTTNTQTFSAVLHRYGANVMIGLSATPKRRDGLDRVIESYLGGVIFSAERARVEVDVHIVNTDVSDYVELYNRRGKVDRVAMISALTENDDRNALIVRTAMKFQHTKVLLLGERREHLKSLCEMLLALGCNSGMYIGGMSETELSRSEACDVILGTYSIASVGLDIKGLNTLVLATPRSDVTQATGRILRDHSGHRKRIFDITDRFSVFYGQLRRRLKCYHEQEFRVVNEGHNANELTEPEEAPTTLMIDDD
jgi:superfamily II DNA or RNA helicase